MVEPEVNDDAMFTSDSKVARRYFSEVELERIFRTGHFDRRDEDSSVKWRGREREVKLV